MAAEKKGCGWRFVQILATKTDEGIDLVYSFMKDGALENLVAAITPDVVVPSITDQFLAAFVFENEIHDLFGVNIEGIAIDFKGNFYKLAQKEPMTIMSPEQKAARDKAAKIAAAKAAKEAKASSDAQAGVQAAASSAGAQNVGASAGDALEKKLAGLDPEKAAKVRAAMEAKAARAKAAQAAKAAKSVEGVSGNAGVEEAVRAAKTDGAHRHVDAANNEKNTVAANGEVE